MKVQRGRLISDARGSSIYEPGDSLNPAASRANEWTNRPGITRAEEEREEIYTRSRTGQAIPTTTVTPRRKTSGAEENPEGERANFNRKIKGRVLH